MHGMHPCSNSRTIILSPMYPANPSVAQTIEVCTKVHCRALKSLKSLRMSRHGERCRVVMNHGSILQWLIFKSLGITCRTCQLLNCILPRQSESLMIPDSSTVIYVKCNMCNHTLGPSDGKMHKNCVAASLQPCHTAYSMRISRGIYTPFACKARAKKNILTTPESDPLILYPVIAYWKLVGGDRRKMKSLENLRNSVQCEGMWFRDQV